MRWWPILLVLVLAAGCAGEEPARDRAAAPAPFVSDAHRFSAELPPGWERAPRSLTPGLSNPAEILSAGTVRALRPTAGACAHMPVAAIERVGPRDAFVSVQERYGEARFPDRPERFALPAPDPGSDAAACARNGGRLDVYWFGFRDARRGFHVLVVLGREAPPARREEALALLDSLRFEPGPEGVHLDSDLVVPYSVRGLAWLMPPRWRHYDRPLTSVDGERLALGTFPLEPGPPDANCAPRAAIDALPPDGAFIYVFEYVDHRVTAPERAGELRLGTETSYECLGRSRMVRWRDRGRDFQAHVALGPRASAALEREARSILNSIQVE